MIKERNEQRKIRVDEKIRKREIEQSRGKVKRAEERRGAKGLQEEDREREEKRGTRLGEMEGEYSNLKM